MDNNLQVITRIVDYVEDHLDEKLDLDHLAAVSDYSKYHLHRMFAGVTGFPVHLYVKRRRLTEAARLLVFTEQPIMEIALFAGYETQQSFTVAFKMFYSCSPQVFRRRCDFYPLQLKFAVDGRKQLRGDRMMDIKTIESGKILLVGYKANTRNGFSVISECWDQLHANKEAIRNRRDQEYLVALNDYSVNYTYENEQPGFDYYAAAEVTDLGDVLPGMVTRELPPSKYVVFCFTGRKEDSMQPVVEYVYGEWFPQSTCRLNENAKYDLVRCGEPFDEEGNHQIELWVPIL